MGTQLDWFYRKPLLAPSGILRVPPGYLLGSSCVHFVRSGEIFPRQCSYVAPLMLFVMIGSPFPPSPLRALLIFRLPNHYRKALCVPHIYVSDNFLGRSIFFSFHCVFLSAQTISIRTLVGNLVIQLLFWRDVLFYFSNLKITNQRSGVQFWYVWTFYIIRRCRKELRLSLFFRIVLIRFTWLVVVADFFP